MMDMDLNRLGIFRSLVQAGSFTRAANLLKQPKSRISRQLAALEEELGLQLIYRTTRQFELTPAGRELYQEISPLLDQLDGKLEQVRSTADEVKGLIRITAPEDIGVELMGKVCQEFMELNPKVYIEMHVGNERRDLVKESFDLALRIGKVEDSSMRQKRIGKASMNFVMSPAFRSRYNLHRLDDLERLPFLGFTALHARNSPIPVKKGKEERELKLQQIFDTNNFFVLRDLVLAGAGFTVLPAFLIREPTEKGDLQIVFRDWLTDGSPVQILSPQQKEMPLRVRAFSDFLAEQLSAYF